MKWACQHCGHVVEREGYTEICPQCWRSTMKGVVEDEQRTEESNSWRDPRVKETWARLEHDRV